MVMTTKTGIVVEGFDDGLLLDGHDDADEPEQGHEERQQHELPGNLAELGDGAGEGGVGVLLHDAEHVEHHRQGHHHEREAHQRERERQEDELLRGRGEPGAAVEGVASDDELPGLDDELGVVRAQQGRVREEAHQDADHHQGRCHAKVHLLMKRRRKAEK